MRLRTTYAQSKDYTYKISTWLARRAIEYGFDRNKFQKSVQALLLDDDDYNTPTLTKQQVKNKKKNAKKKLKKKQQASGDARTKDGEQPEDGEHEDDIEPPASQTDSPTPSIPNTGQQQRQPEMTGDYVITTEQYVELANFLAEKKVPIPLELLQIIRRCIRLRLDTLKCFLPKADLSTYTHAFFIDTLRSVGFILHEAREQAFVDNARQHSSSSGNNSRSAQKSETTSNRFASLADLVQDLEEADGDDIEDASAIELSEPPRSTSSSAANGSGNKARFTAVQTTETAIMALLAVLDDFHSVRESISSLWARYSEGKCDLITAALTTNTALELLRRPYNEVIGVLLPKFNNSIEYLLGHLLEFLSDRSTGDGGRHALVRASMNENDSELSKKELYIYRQLLASPLKLITDLKSVVKEHPDSLFPELYDDSLDLKTLSVRKRHEQEFLLMCGSYSENVREALLIEADREMTTQGLQYDQLQESMCEKIDEEDCTLYAALCAQIFLDINAALGAGTKRAFEELREGATQMKETLLERKRAALTFPEQLWGERGENMAAQLFENVENKHHILTCPKQEHGSYHALMKRSPVQCGMLLFALRTQYQNVGYTLISTTRSITATGIFYRACRDFATWEPEEYPKWPDLNAYYTYMGEEAEYGGKKPESIQDAHINIQHMMGVSGRALQHIRQKDAMANHRDFGPSRAGHFTEEVAARRNPAPLMRLITAHQAGTASVGLASIEEYLAERAAEADRSVTKKGGDKKNRPPAGKSKSKYSMVRLMKELETGLAKEDISINFDFISMHLRCFRVLKLVYAAVIANSRRMGLARLGMDWDFPIKPQGEDVRFVALPLVILRYAAHAEQSMEMAQNNGEQDEKITELARRTREMFRESAPKKDGTPEGRHNRRITKRLTGSSPGLYAATSAIGDFLQSGSNEGDAELRKMKGTRWLAQEQQSTTAKWVGINPQMATGSFAESLEAIKAREAEIRAASSSTRGKGRS